MDLAVANCCRHLFVRILIFAGRGLSLNAHWQGSEYLVVDWQIFRRNVMGNLIVRTFYHLVFVQLADALETERVTAWQGKRLLFIVVVRLETNATFKYLVHFFAFSSVVLWLVVK